MKKLLKFLIDFRYVILSLICVILGIVAMQGIENWVIGCMTAIAIGVLYIIISMIIDRILCNRLDSTDD